MRSDALEGGGFLLCPLVYSYTPLGAVSPPAQVTPLRSTARWPRVSARGVASAAAQQRAVLRHQRSRRPGAAPGSRASGPTLAAGANLSSDSPGSPSSRVTVARKGAGDRNEIFNISVPQNESELSFSILSSGDTLFPLKDGAGAGERLPRAPSPSPQRQASSLGAPPAADKGQRTRAPGRREGRRLH